MDYQLLCAELRALTDGIPYETANLAKWCWRRCSARDARS